MLIIVYILNELQALTPLPRGSKGVIGFPLCEVSEGVKTKRSKHILRLRSLSPCPFEPLQRREGCGQGQPQKQVSIGLWRVLFFSANKQTNIYIVVRKNLSVQCVMAKNDKKSSFQSTPEILLSLSKYQIFLPLNRCPPFWFYYGKAVSDNLYEELYKMR